MNRKKNKLIGISPAEFDVGCLLNNDEVFALARSKLKPRCCILPELKQLMEVMIEHGNSIEAIAKHNRVIAIYAMFLSNHVSDWTIKLKEKSA